MCPLQRQSETNRRVTWMTPTLFNESVDLPPKSTASRGRTSVNHRLTTNSTGYTEPKWHSTNAGTFCASDAPGAARGWTRNGASARTEDVVERRRRAIRPLIPTCGRSGPATSGHLAGPMWCPGCRSETPARRRVRAVRPPMGGGPATNRARHASDGGVSRRHTSRRSRVPR